MATLKLKNALKSVLSEKELHLLVRGYDVIGDVAIIMIPDELDQLEKVIADALLRNLANIRVVARRVGKYSGEFRTLSLKKISGSGGLQTIHKEFGIRLHVNPETVYFSPRSANERYRIAGLIKPEEHVLVMFSGIAPLPLMIGRYSGAKTITGIEKNPHAHILAEKNLQINRKIENISLFNGDVLQIVPVLGHRFNRIAMPLPRSAGVYLDLALQALAPKGWLHFYDFQKRGEFEQALDVVRRACAAMGREMVRSHIQPCGHVSPEKYRVCVDALVV